MGDQLCTMYVLWIVSSFYIVSSVSCLHSSVITVLCIIWPLVYCVFCLVSIVCFFVYLYPQCYVHVHLDKSFIHTSSLCLEPQSPPLKGWSKPFVAPPPPEIMSPPPPLSRSKQGKPPWLWQCRIVLRTRQCDLERPRTF